MISFFLSVLAGGGIGFVLSTANIGLTNWRFWAIIACLMLAIFASHL